MSDEELVPVKWLSNGHYIREKEDDFYAPGQTGKLPKGDAEGLQETDHLVILDEEEPERDEEGEDEGYEPEWPALGEMTPEEVFEAAEILADDLSLEVPEAETADELLPWIEEHYDGES